MLSSVGRNLNVVLSSAIGPTADKCHLQKPGFLAVDDQVLHDRPVVPAGRVMRPVVAQPRIDDNRSAISFAPAKSAMAENPKKQHCAEEDP
jgi:hypothetical protein